ncbi:diguanylate cyclase (GGDEF) domain-containing protein [Oscillibacter sp. PC13]|uniref:sensor domain-containing diguanylate cyclase n=1 Tax=Oscillibacter sp. PC13 TaxID=1855299 RepID=UPI0008DF3FD9|nr:GGDEF domain-containing protein [Oscillibacter sp. PC13]SFQ08041.1 diguanylate cyclase (GGDEF) domain-containing protein [Oscillibacter sp. PC13]
MKKQRTTSESTIIKNALDVIFEQNDVVSAIHTVLKMLGQHFGADRAYIFEDNIDHLGSRNTYEWCAAGIPPQKDNLQHVSYEDILDYPISELFKEKSVWYRSDFSKVENGSLKKLLLKKNIKPAILVGLFEYGDFAGFIGLDICDAPKELASEQIELLQVMAKIFSYAISGAKYTELRGLASSLQERSRDLKDQISTERKAFFDVMGNNALFTVHSDLTDGLIIEDILAPDGSSLLAALGFSVPAPYDEEGRAFIETNRVEMITPNAARCFQHKEAMNIFYEGIGSAPYDIYIGSTDMYVRMNVIFYKNQDNGHVMCYCMCTDTSEQYKEIRQLKKLEVINEQLKYESTHEGNTGLLNRSAAKDQIESCINSRDGKTVALILIDIDNFKSINDRFGHTVGDKAIFNVAETMRKRFRKTDVLSRFGGDEFAVFIKDVSKTSVLMDRIEDFLSHVTELVIEKNLTIPLTCSVGLAIAQNGEMDFNTLYRHADTALYFSKNNGKNRYCVYSEEMSL